MQIGDAFIAARDKFIKKYYFGNKKGDFGGGLILINTNLLIKKGPGGPLPK